MHVHHGEQHGGRVPPAFALGIGYREGLPRAPAGRALACQNRPARWGRVSIGPRPSCRAGQCRAAPAHSTHGTRGCRAGLKGKQDVREAGRQVRAGQLARGHDGTHGAPGGMPWFIFNPDSSQAPLVPRSSTCLATGSQCVVGSSCASHHSVHARQRPGGGGGATIGAHRPAP